MRKELSRPSCVSAPITRLRLSRLLERILLPLAIVGWLAGLPSAQAQQIVPLIPFGQNWAYNQAGADLGTAWRAPGYNDSQAPWSSGQALLGFEETTLYPVPFLTPLTPPQTGGPITVYFRTRFQFNSSTTGVSLVATNLLDDGAVVYLNGQELYRYRVPANPVTFTSLAGGQGAEGVYEVMNVAGSSLIQGENVLAVELHQSSATSSDLAFGMSLTALLPIPVSILEQPMSQTAFEGATTVLTVAATGFPLQYQWYKNDVAIPNAQDSSYTLQSTRFEDAGTYHVVVSNILNTVRSSNAVLDVTVDREGPELVWAVADENTNVNYRIVVEFSEDLLNSTASDTANYTITEMGTGNQLTVLRTAHSRKFVQLRVSGWTPGRLYVLTVRGVADVRGNVILAESQIGVGFWNELFPVERFWMWDQPFFTEPEADWKESTFDDSFWAGPDMPPFQFESDPLSSCFAFSTEGTRLSTGLPTAYFRISFDAPTNSGTARLRFRSLIDDGAVFYLNGVEIYRYNMPGGAVDINTRASSAVGNASCLLSPEIPVTNLLSGQNLLAVEVHQAAPDGNDTVFAVSLDAAIPQALPPRPRLSVVRQGANMIQISWNGTGFKLQAANRLDGGTWTQVATSSPFAASTAGDMLFYRLVQ